MIRAATHEDMESILRMGRNFCQALGEKFDRRSVCEHVEWLIDNDISTVLVCEVEEIGVVGMVSGVYIPVYFDNSRTQATEMWWWVDEEARKLGVGTELIDGLESWARQAGAERLSMMIMHQLDKSIVQIYEKRGYHIHESTFLKEF